VLSTSSFPSFSKNSSVSVCHKESRTLRRSIPSRHTGTGCPRRLWMPHPWRHSGQAGCGSGQPGLVVGDPAHSRGLELDDHCGPFQPTPFYDSMTKQFLGISTVFTLAILIGLSIGLSHKQRQQTCWLFCPWQVGSAAAAKMAAETLVFCRVCLWQQKVASLGNAYRKRNKKDFAVYWCSLDNMVKNAWMLSKTLGLVYVQARHPSGLAQKL